MCDKQPIVENRKMKFGVLTSGGDAAGMNYAVASIVRYAKSLGINIVGIKDGYKGIIDGTQMNLVEFTMEDVLRMESMRGTWLRTDRCEEFYFADTRKQAAENLRAAGIDALIVIGGDGSFTGAWYLAQLGIPCVGIPATVDNDLEYTEYTLGFDTAVGVCVDAVNSVRATGYSHRRPQVVEVMGRSCGEIAVATAKATGAEIVLVPEVQWSLDWVSDRVAELFNAGNARPTVIVTENCWKNGNMEDCPWIDRLNEGFERNYQEDMAAYEKRCVEREVMLKRKLEKGEPIMPFETKLLKKPVKKHLDPNTEFDSHRLAQYIEMRTGLVTRHTVVGYPQRGERCSAKDGRIAFECGKHAVDLLAAFDGKEIISRAIRVFNGKIDDVPFERVFERVKHSDRSTVNFINHLI